MVIRELVTKLGFSLDKSKLHEFDKSIGKLKKGVGSLTANLDQVGKGMQSAGLKLSLALSAPLIIANTAAITAAASVEQLEVSFETMLGGAEKANEMIRDMFAFAAKTPFEIKNIGPTVKQLLAMGISQKKMIPTLKALGDISAGLDVPLSRLALNYGQVKTQGKLTGRELRDFSMAGVPLVEELAKITGKAKKEIAGMISAGGVSFPMVEKAFVNMTKEGGRFNNLMGKQALTLKGLFSNLMDNLFMLSASYGKIVVETLNLKGAIEGLNKFFSKLLKTFKNLSPFMQKFIIFFSVFLIILGPILLGLGTLIILFGAVAKSLMILKLAFWGAAEAAGGFNAMVFLIPALILAAIALIALLLEDLYVWVRGGDSLTGKLLGPWEKYSGGLKKIFSGIKKGFNIFLEGMKSFLSTGKNMFFAFVNGPLKAFARGYASIFLVIYNVILIIKRFVTNLFILVKNSKFLAENIVKPFLKLKDAIKNIFKSIVKAITGVYKEPLLEYVDWWKEVIKLTKGPIEFFKQLFLDAFSVIKNGLLTLFGPAIKLFKLLNKPIKVKRKIVDDGKKLKPGEKPKKTLSEKFFQDYLNVVKFENQQDPVKKAGVSLAANRIRRRVSNNNVSKPVQVKNTNNITFNDASSVTNEQALKISDKFTTTFEQNLQKTLDNEINSNQALE